MRKSLALAALAGIALLVLGAFQVEDARSQGSGIASRWKTLKPHWEQYGPTAGVGNGTKVDTVFFDGAVQTVDTTEAIPIGADANYGWAGQGSTVSGCLRVGISSDNGIACDSLFCAVETAPTSRGPWRTGSQVGGVAATSGDDWMTIMLLCDDTNAASTASDMLLGAQWIRLIFRIDGNTAAKMPGAKAYISYPIWSAN